jgi:hypothetical protein
MGLANDELVKAGVSTLTFVLEAINKIIDAISGGNGLSKSIITLMTVIGALRGGGKILAKIFGSNIVKTFIESMKEVPKKAGDSGESAG